MVGVVEGGVDRPGVEPEEPCPQPVVVAVLHDTEVGRRRDDKPGSVRSAAGAQRGPNPGRDVPRVAEEGDAFGRRAGLPE